MKLVFLNLGRRGAGVQLTYRLLASALNTESISAFAVISASAENAADFRELAAGRILEVETYRPLGPFSLAANFPAARKAISRYLDAIGADAVFCVMPHVWTPLLAKSIQRAGVAYGTLIHDATPHPGDPTALVTHWLRSEALSADLVVTMSINVADKLRGDGVAAAGRLLALFHPDYTYSGAAISRRRQGKDAPLNLLFFGRILPYKGIELLANTLAELRKRQVPVELTIAGEGVLGESGAVLRRLGARIINRWQGEGDIAALFSEHDAAIVSHIEASQSGVPALAYAHGMPVVSTPVGGLTEQVVHEQTGLLAHLTSAIALADAVSRLQRDAPLYNRLVANIAAQRAARSPERFVAALIARLSAL